MNGPEDEVSLLDQTGACLCQSLENVSKPAVRPTSRVLHAVVTLPAASQEKRPVRLFRVQMHEELSAAKQKLCATVMAQRVQPAHRHHQGTRGVSNGDRSVSKPADVVRIHAPLPMAN